MLIAGCLWPALQMPQERLEEKMKLRSVVMMGMVVGLMFAGPITSVSAANKTQSGTKASVSKSKSVRSKSAQKAPARLVKRTSVKKSKRIARAKAVVAASAAAAASDGLPALDHDGNPLLASASVLVMDQSSGEVLLEKNARSVVPIASITKLMTAMVVLDSHPNLSEFVVVDESDIDTLKGSRSRLPVGSVLSREDMLRVALMASENRAASSLARHYPGGMPAFVAAMNQKANSLGLVDTRFYDSTGLNSGNVSSARDLTKLVSAASRYPLIREFSTSSEYYVEVRGQMRRFGNTNALVKNSEWQIGLSKTGFINESGRCLVMQAWLRNKPMIIVLLDSFGKYTRTADAQRIKKWVETVGDAPGLAARLRPVSG